jgi:hypothetical protein
MRDLEIYDLFQIINDKGTGVICGRVMFRSEIDFQMSQWTIFVTQLDIKGQSQSKEVENPNRPDPDSPKSAEEKEKDPKEMEQDHQISQDFIRHCRPPISSERPFL